MRYIIKNDTPDFDFSIDVGTVTDAEGEVLPDESISLEIESSDPDVLEVTVNEDGKSGRVHVGHSGVAAFTVSAKGPNGDVLASGADDFTVTPGDPKAVSEIKTNFAGLEPEGETGGSTEGEPASTGTETDGESEGESEAQPAEESSESTGAEETASSESEESAPAGEGQGGVI